MVVFAEGTTNNGAHIMPFKQGAFAGMRTLTPVFQSNDSYGIKMTPHFDSSMAFFPLLIMMFSTLTLRQQKIQIMPPFTPTPWMLEKHADKGEEPWQIYAWCLRDAMCKFGGVPTFEHRVRY